MSWNAKVVVLGVACVMGAGAGVLYVYQRMFIESVSDGPEIRYSELLADAGGVGIGLVLVHGLVRWGTETGWRSGGKRLWGWWGGCSVGAVLVLLLWLSRTDQCRGVFELFPIWIVAAAWWLSGDSESTGRSSRWREYATAGVVLVLYAVSVFPLLPHQLGGGRPSTRLVITVNGEFDGEVTRWRSGDWVFPRDETPARWFPWRAQRVDATSGAPVVVQPVGGTFEGPVRPETEEPTRDVLLLDPAPQWVSSGAWDGRDERLLLVDPSLEKIFSYPVAGAAEGEEVRVGRGETIHGSVLRRFGEGYLLEREDGELLRLTADFGIWGEIDLKAGSWGRGHRIGGVYQWTPVVGDQLLALVDFEERVSEAEPTRWGAAFVRIDLREPGDFEILREVSRDRLSWFGMNLVAAATDRGWFVDSDRGELVEVDFGASESELRVVTSITVRPRGLATEGTEESVQAMESASFTSGVYTEATGRVWLLERTAEDGAVSWRIDAVDPGTGERRRAGRVLSEATWVTVVPGPRRWAVVEKGSVEGLGKHEPPITRAVLFSTVELVAAVEEARGAER